MNRFVNRKRQAFRAKRAFRIAVVSGCVAFGITSAADAAIAITSLAANTIGYAVSGDGSTVTGGGFRWTAPGGTQSLAGTGWALTPNGSVIVGGTTVGGNERAFRWTAATGVVQIGVLPGGSGSTAYAVSADGTIVAGGSYRSGGLQSGFRWTAATGMQDLGSVPGGDQSIILGMNSTGSVMVGSASGPLTIGSRPVRWTAATGMQDIGTPPGSSGAQATAVTPDGSVIAGWGQADGIFGMSAYRWTSAGPEELSPVPGDQFSIMFGINGDGSILVGSGSATTNSGHATLWSPSTGSVDLNTFLPSRGLDLTGWNLSYASGISTDGSAISGYGSFNGQTRAFVITGVTIPEPVTFATTVGTAMGVLVRRRRV